mmetsp:Transcript_16935/g.22004  ORF Transcript_16935/g.22004 Transcript_16935/m.22004 type:complete len:151 (-) Transcript_16935:1-453(-)
MGSAASTLSNTSFILKGAQNLPSTFIRRPSSKLTSGTPRTRATSFSMSCMTTRSLDSSFVNQNSFSKSNFNSSSPKHDRDEDLSDSYAEYCLLNMREVKGSWTLEQVDSYNRSPKARKAVFLEYGPFSHIKNRSSLPTYVHYPQVFFFSS